MSSDYLREALDEARPRLETALEQAESELAELDARRDELLDLIARAKAALGEDHSTVSGAKDSPQTLHEALALILREHGNEPMTARELADEVTARGLYRKRDGSPVEINQVHARTKNYSTMFAKEDGRIRLR